MALQLCSEECPVWKRGGGEQCAAQQKLQKVLGEIFHYEKFRPCQLEALLPDAHGKDVFVRMPTGGGKSLCMFLVPLAIGDEAMGIVVSPLVGLVEQQVTQLNSVGVSAIHGHTLSHIQEIKAGMFRFVFISPETAQLAEWKCLFSDIKIRKKVALVAVDEAHCITEWGADFRKDFRHIGGLRALLQAPFMALTASAPPAVQADIVSSLFLVDPVIISHNLDRQNIYISASPVKSLDSDLHGIVDILKSSIGFIIPKIIIYVQTKDMAWRVHSYLQRESSKQHYVTMYHGSLTQTTKSTVYQDFKSGNSAVRCLVATVAFGMGMDIPDVEVVVVYGTPSTTSQLYQLFGRAGRNGIPSRAHLFYNVKKNIVDQNMKMFVEQGICRRESLLKSLGSVGERNGSNSSCCDICHECIGSSRLDILRVAKRRRKPRRVRRTVSPSLESKLLDMRGEILKEHPSFEMVGISFLCLDSTVKKLCQEAEFSSSAIDSAVNLRAIVKDKFKDLIH